MDLVFTHPDRCVVGTVGEPGKRLFLIQIAQGSTLAAVAIEKEQAQLLGRRIGDILDQLAALGHDVPPRGESRDLGPLDAPLTVSFRAGAIGLAWDGGRNAVQIELFPVEAEQARAELVQVWLRPAMAREFSARTEVVVASGRQACPVCAQPIGPGGHICPRANGYRGPLF
ncbi:MAG TPA: DUF3090 domain-containing protein [Arachnia sp.]|nr:DUF3090 domain-containing protein [Arachnia sp.]HMT85060.1 DUF3090 domain-containing protein [Arachnia sp.]